MLMFIPLFKPAHRKFLCFTIAGAAMFLMMALYYRTFTAVELSMTHFPRSLRMRTRIVMTGTQGSPTLKDEIFSVRWQKVSRGEMPVLYPPPCRKWHQGVKRVLDRKEGNHRLPVASVVLFTTLKQDARRRRIHRNTLQNWSRLGPQIRPVLLTDPGTDLGLLGEARRLGWDTLPLPPHQTPGPPRVKHMFRLVARHYPDAAFIGLANADILFDPNLLMTLEEVYHRAMTSWDQAVVVGARYNIDNREGATIKDPGHVNRLIRHNATSHISRFAADYFFIYRNKYPWKRFKDGVLMGRLGYDNYLVGLAITASLPVIDASCTVGALHQMGAEGHRSGFLQEDARVNYDIIGTKKFFKVGRLNNATYLTQFDKSRDKQIVVLEVL